MLLYFHAVLLVNVNLLIFILPQCFLVAPCDFPIEIDDLVSDQGQ